MLSIGDFKDVGGDPSNSWGSKYSELCRLVERFSETDYFGSYLSALQRELLTKIVAKIADFKSSGHGGVGGDTLKLAKKAKETAAVGQLEASLAHDLKIAKVSELLDQCARHATPLISNTGKGWRAKLTNDMIAKRATINFNVPVGSNAQWNGQSLSINEPSFWNAQWGPGRFATAILVHEYHHLLTERKPSIYHDEFVAHWKQYEVQFGLDGYPHGVSRQGRINHINNFILDASNGYKQRSNLKGPELTRPEDTGSVWYSYLDNA